MMRVQYERFHRVKHTHRCYSSYFYFENEFFLRSWYGEETLLIKNGQVDFLLLMNTYIYFYFILSPQSQLVALCKLSATMTIGVFVFSLYLVLHQLCHHLGFNVDPYIIACSYIQQKSVLCIFVKAKFCHCAFSRRRFLFMLLYIYHQSRITKMYI